MFKAIDNYFGWVTKGGFKRLFLGLILPAIIGIFVIVGATGGSKKADTAAPPVADAAGADVPVASVADKAAAQAAAKEATQTAKDAETQAKKDAAAAVATVAAAPKLALASSNCLKDTIGYVTCKGFVQNIGTEPLRSIQVVIVWQDANGTPQNYDTGFLEFDPILPQQQSPWTTIGKANPALTKYTVSLKQFAGKEYSYRDDRKR